MVLFLLLAAAFLRLIRLVVPRSGGEEEPASRLVRLLARFTGDDADTQS
jgi:hypothetical protein